MHTCRICGNEKGNNQFQLREMMFGIKDKFDYFECSKCGTLQIKDIPLDMSPYYRYDYYSFNPPKQKNKNQAKLILKKMIARLALLRNNPLIRLLPPDYLSVGPFSWIRTAGLKTNYRILDIGSGSGTILMKFSEYGFKNLTGADPFIKKDIYYKNKIKIFKKDISKIRGEFDFIFLHHSFEHMTEPEEVMRHIYRLLKPNRYALLVIPIVSYAWRKYGTNWVQLDAPRHFFIHTIKGIKLLAQKTDFEVKKIDYLSTEFQFWGSEQYLEDIPLFSQKSYGVNTQGSIFSPEDIVKFKKQAALLNKKKDGDTVAIYLYKSSLER